MKSDEAAASEIFNYHGCVSGDCPHEKKSECFMSLIAAGIAHERGRVKVLLDAIEDLREDSSEARWFVEYYLDRALAQYDLSRKDKAE